MRSENQGTDYALADHVQAGSLQFTYYDDDGIQLPSPQYGLGVATNVRCIRWEIVFQDGTESLPVRALIAPRNLPHVSEHFS